MATQDEAILGWETPPDTHFGRGLFDVESVMTALKDNPDEWGVIATDVSGSYIHTSPLVKELRELGCEVKAPKEGGVRKLYARYVGTNKTRRGRAA